MTRRSKLWRVGAALFVIINVAGAAYAIVMGEPMHAATHAVLLTLGLGGYLTWRIERPSRSNAVSSTLADERLDYLQRSVDAIALEVERIGEAQRFHEKLRGERVEPPPLKKEQ
ncbi:MAG: hypothetical protein ACJ8AJ_00260 [Gemmatimonadaceae bacterium]